MSKRFREIKGYFRDLGVKINNRDVRKIIHKGDIIKKHDIRTLCHYKQAHLDDAYERLKRRMKIVLIKD